MTRDDLTLIRLEAEKNQSKLTQLESLVSAAQKTSARASMLTRANVSGQLKTELKQIDEDAIYLFKQLQSMAEEHRPTAQYWNFQHSHALAEYNANAVQNRADQNREILR
jgi:hypothetical protein